MAARRRVSAWGPPSAGSRATTTSATPAFPHSNPPWLANERVDRRGDGGGGPLRAQAKAGSPAQPGLGTPCPNRMKGACLPLLFPAKILGAKACGGGADSRAPLHSPPPPLSWERPRRPVPAYSYLTACSYYLTISLVNQRTVDLH